MSNLNETSQVQNTGFSFQKLSLSNLRNCSEQSNTESFTLYGKKTASSHCCFHVERFYNASLKIKNVQNCNIKVSLIMFCIYRLPSSISLIRLFVSEKSQPRPPRSLSPSQEQHVCFSLSFSLLLQRPPGGA